jgi:ribosome-binding protein aMBF1 (putative translation factor)
MSNAKAEDTVVLTRIAYEALLDRIEDAEDRAAIAEHRVEVRSRGRDRVIADALSVDAVERLLAGVHPLRIWREHRGLSAKALAERAGVSAAYLSEIETGVKPGSVDAISRLAKALGVSIEDVVRT